MQERYTELMEYYIYIFRYKKNNCTKDTSQKYPSSKKYTIKIMLLVNDMTFEFYKFHQ